MTTGLTNFNRIRCDGDGNETVGQFTGGVVKVHNRTSTTGGYSLEVKGEPTQLSGTFFGVETTVDHKPSAATSALGARGNGGICRLAATYTMTSGSLVGSYGQVCSLGTLNGSGIMVSGSYSLVADGGTYTAVSHINAAWLDSQLAQTITAGKSEFLYITNNGSTTFDNALYVYAGNKITNLFEINTASGMVGANQAGGSTLNFTNYRLIKIVLEGETYYLPAAKTIA